MEQVNMAVAVAGSVVVLLGLGSARAESLPLSKPLLALGAGVMVGPELLGWLAPQQWEDQHLILKEATRFTLAISVFGIALRTPREDYRRLLRPVGLLLTLGMLVMWGVSAGLAWTILGVSPLVALLLGAIVTPTDPVVASSIVTGGLAKRSLPDRLRSTLSLESGANDGLAYLIVPLPMLLIETTPVSAAIGRWLTDTVLVGVVLAVAIGAGTGYLTALALHWVDRKEWVEEHSLLGLTVALSLVVVAGTKLAGSDGILAAFAAGAAFNLGVDRSEDFEEQNVQEAIGKLFNLPVFVLLGTMLPWRGWIDMGWQVLAFAVGIILLRRPLALVAAGPGLGAGMQRRDAAFLGWFGPVGIAAVYYALHAEEQIHDATLWHATSLVVVSSIVLHGVTSAPGLAAYRHGAPGIAPAEFALGMMPVPSNLVAAARDRPPEEIYWFIRNGLKMSGMPAWEMRMSEADMWRLTALVEALPTLSPVDYAALEGRARNLPHAPDLPDGPGLPEAIGPVPAEATALETAVGSPDRGRVAMQVHGCLQCHMIPGLVGRADLHVGPPLHEAGTRSYIAGVLRNTPDNMVRWIMHPQDIDPLSAMPDLGVSEALARDMAAYLYSISPEPRGHGEGSADAGQ